MQHAALGSGPVALLAYASSYALRRPTLALRAARKALSWPATLAITPLAVAWSAVEMAKAMVAGAQIAWRARSVPVLAPSHGLLAALGELTPIASLVSDTHLTDAGKIPCELAVDPAQWPFRTPPASEALEASLREVLEHIHANAPRTVIWCGDEVDTGSAAEWERWRAATEGVPGLAHRLVPGNHDICFNRPFDEDYRLRRRAERETAFQAHGDRLADFPLVDQIVGDAGPATVILLDSCKFRSRHILSNAIGFFGDVQLDEVERTLARTTGPVLVIAHHHVWRDTWFASPADWYNTAVDAARLAQILLAYRRRHATNRVLVCHGHRHVLTTGTISDGPDSIDVLGLPSTTLGCKARGGVLDGIPRYAVVGLREDASWGVALVPVT